ncbi:NAD(P)-dependent oxidoreductase [Leuconostoc mesenteroides]|uniref:NAD(P)-dependent oxidoreductase n=1 Tax=Leuconostoc mesenteroides TaxID=1245 RepID=UPI001238545E|nr:NAD-dependent epimerase/dehydratase family protein [Leuconostoc mesenteroides]KAA8346484.1 NADH-flavin reductase [Leuconostoc mesenteroides]
MKLLIIGATGMTGQSLVAEAISNGLSVVANGRNLDKLSALNNEFKDITILNKDAFGITLSDLEDVDVIIDAFATAPDQAYLQIDLAAHLISLLRNSSKRIGFILGAGSLYTDESKSKLTYDLIAEDDSTKPWSAIPENQLYELEFLRRVKNVNWFGVSPGSNFIAGEKSDNILVGDDILLMNDQNVSETTSGTMAFKVIEEVKNNQYNQKRFTVANG